jgi:phenylalanyl-tRNA synthetase alpha chain
MSDLAALENRALSELRDCADEASLHAWHAKHFGKQGDVVLALKKVGTVPPEQRREYGQSANRVKESLLQAHEAALTQLKEKALQRSLAADALDVTLPGRPIAPGRLHVATKVMREICAIFADMGF